MRVVETRTRNFRNLCSQRLAWDRGLNLFVGANGAGKTNFLETFHVLTGWGPFEGALWACLSQWDCDEPSTMAASLDGEREAMVEVSFRQRPSLRLDGKKATWSTLRSFIPSLSFLPTHMALIEGSSAVRRRFLDVLCSILFPVYAFRLSQYRKVLRHRRCLLVAGKKVSLTSRPMGELSGWIWRCRQQAVAALQTELDQQSGLLPLPLELAVLRGGAGLAFEPLDDFFESEQAMMEREFHAKTPLVGPHRDDMTMVCGSRVASEVLSRGQRRRSAMALVLAAASLVEHRMGRRPLLIIDEIWSELDDEGKKILVENLCQSQCQVFAATTDLKDCHWPGSVWLIEKGQRNQLL